MAWTYIRVSRATRERVKALKVHPRETYEEALSRLLAPTS